MIPPESAPSAPRVHHLGVTNYDTPHLRAVLEHHVPIKTNQIQYSLLDRRADASGLVKLMQLYGVKLLAFGVVAGGWLSDRWYGAKDPAREYVPAMGVFLYNRFPSDVWGFFVRCM